MVKAMIIKDNLRALSEIAKGIGFMRFGWPKVIPRLINLPVTYRCNSKCTFCSIWKKKPGSEFTAAEFEKFIEKNRPLFIGYTGGEPFLREDLASLWVKANTNFSVFTNGILTDKILSTIEEFIPKAKKPFYVDVSMDGFEETHNNLRGVNIYHKAMQTLAGLKALSDKNSLMSCGASFTVCAQNQDEFVDFYGHMNAKGFDVGFRVVNFNSYYGTTDQSINLDVERFLSQVERIPKTNYILLLRKYLKNPAQVVACAAGFTSAWINPDWSVFPCISREDYVVGNLKDVGFDLKNIWFNEKMNSFRAGIKNHKCHCFTDCEIYNSMRHDPRHLVGICLRKGKLVSSQ
ncbi:MAG: radical SAM protein [Candidatus Altiarchaeota archaeon]